LVSEQFDEDYIYKDYGDYIWEDEDDSSSDSELESVVMAYERAFEE
jgi:hypothetical protein